MINLKLRQLRKERKIKQAELAKAIGVSLRAYQYYESGERNPDIIILGKLADYFNVSTDYLLGRMDNNL